MSLNSRISELRDKRDYYQMELEDLHMSEPSQEMYKQRRYEIEAQIFHIEDAIDSIERENRIMRPMRYMLIGFCIVSIGMLLYSVLTK
jgi:hypothetical protein